MKRYFLALLALHLGLAAVVAQPVITSHPQWQTNFIGAAATFSVGATGTSPLFYQWRRSSTLLEEQTNSTLVLTNLQLSAVGLYSVVVSNLEGSVTSSNARLYVVTAPTITPANPTARLFADITLVGSNAPAGPVSYQWLFNDVPIPDAVTNKLIVTNIQQTNVGNFAIVVTYAFGSITSHVATLQITAFNSLYCFGHSWTDTGRSPPNGGNYWKNHWSNGPMWPEYLSTNLGLTYDPARNFAVAGAPSGDVLNLQIPQLSSPSDARWSLFVVWGLEGDFAQAEFANPNLDQSVTNDALWNGLIRTMIQNTTNSIAALYARGARTIVLPSMFAYGSTPGAPGNDPIYTSSDSTRSILNQWSARANVALISALDDLDRVKPDLRILRLDVYAKFNQLLANFSDYGFTKALPPAQFDPALSDRSITGPGTNYVWWDGRHVTTKTHGIWASWINDLVARGSLEKLGITVTGSTETLQMSKLESGRDYTLQKSTDLSNWTDVLTFTALAGTNQVTQVRNIEPASVFYRLQWWPRPATGN